MAAPSAVVCAPVPLPSVASATWESVHATMGRPAGSASIRCTSSRATRSATSSTRVLLQALPAGARSSCSFPDGRTIRAPGSASSGCDASFCRPVSPDPHRVFW